MSGSLRALSFALAVAGVACTCSSTVAAETTSEADKTFVGMVSQGGLFESRAGLLAMKSGGTQDVRDQGATEAHDHGLVNAKLKTIATAAGLPISGTLNAMFEKEYDALAALSGTAFDDTYLKDMAALHEKDGAAFLKESTDGTNAALKAFAAETHVIVLRHIGEIDAVGPTTK